jgi:hypothetical protein
MDKSSQEMPQPGAVMSAGTTADIGRLRAHFYKNTIEGYYQSVETHPNLARGQGIRDRESGAR